MIQTYKEAVTVMQHPRFGDERCIEARDVMRLAGRLREIRKRVPRDGTPREWKGISTMSVSQIEAEIELLERQYASAWEDAAGKGPQLVKRA